MTVTALLIVIVGLLCVIGAVLSVIKDKLHQIVQLLEQAEMNRELEVTGYGPPIMLTDEPRPIP